MNPLLLSALFSFAPGLLAGLFGNPQQKLRRQLFQLQSPGNVGALTNRFYQQALGSPAYSQALGTIAAGANQGAGQLASELGARGIGTSGTGAILSSLTPSIVGSQQAQLRTSAYGSAQQQAQQSIERQIQALLGTQGPSPMQSGLGGGFEAFAPIFLSWLKSKYPGMFTAPTPALPGRVQ